MKRIGSFVDPIHLLLACSTVYFLEDEEKSLLITDVFVIEPQMRMLQIIMNVILCNLSGMGFESNPCVTKQCIDSHLLSLCSLFVVYYSLPAEEAPGAPAERVRENGAEVTGTCGDVGLYHLKRTARD